ncbi:embryo sac development arrest protein [Thalictrum thalictroides]|uniref:Embryo sac development arrest protein n=1 Tax=Thalictrum thalictroides TaxID=46969 RepID=A0A7J6X2H8_THATH|nr:embryo sac development arrest protein [Thalictrum thalictroides]
MSNSNHTRGFLPLGVSRKRSETGSKTGFDGFKKPSKLSRPVSSSSSSLAAKKLVDQKPVCDNRLLAGYMASEFLTKGTLFGQQYDPARAEAAPVSAKSKAEKKDGKNNCTKPTVKHQSYADVANMLKSDGTHIPGIVNPTQLARWLQM